VFSIVQDRLGVNQCLVSGVILAEDLNRTSIIGKSGW